MTYERIYYPESRFGGFTYVDGTIAFYTRVRSLLGAQSVALDVGCGRGAYADDPVAVRRELRTLRGRCRRVIGIDVDPVARVNPAVDEVRLIEDGRWPVEDASADLCLCDSVVEHVEDVDAFFSECRRALKDGGVLCIRTPNVLSYFGLMVKLIPRRHHTAVVRKVQDRREAEDVFPTWYRCNTKRKMAQMLRRHGFDGVVSGYEAEPMYLSFSRFLYWLGVLHQRHAPERFRLTLFVFARKVARVG